MIRAEAASGEATDYAERILEQTQNITHVVMEFLKYARPLEISNEPVALQTVVDRVVAEIGEAHPEIRIRHEGPFGEVAGDEGLLRQALLTLARNAAEACVSAANEGRVLGPGGGIPRQAKGFQRLTVFGNRQRRAQGTLP